MWIFWFYLSVGKGGYENINRLTMLHVLNNMPTANVSIKYKFMGPSSTNATACSTGASSIGDGFRFIQLGEVFFVFWDMIS